VSPYLAACGRGPDLTIAAREYEAFDG